MTAAYVPIRPESTARLGPLGPRVDPTRVAPSTAQPHLGDTRATFRERLGHSLNVLSPGQDSTEVFVCRGVPIMVMFSQDRAMAIRAPFATQQPRMLAQPLVPAIFGQSGKRHLRVLVADRGWLVATPDCPLPALRALAAL